MGRGRLKPGWTRVAFGDVAVSVNDRIDNPLDAGVERYVGLEHLDSDSLAIRRWAPPTAVTATKLLFRRGDIIFGRRRVYQRKLAVADFDGICSAHALVLRAKSRVVSPEFLPFFMQSDSFMRRAEAISVGSLSPTINWRTLASEEFALPPLDEQRRMANLLTRTEATSRALQDAHAALATLRKSTLMHSFGHRLADPVMPQVPLVALGDFITVAQYGTSTPTVRDGRYPLLRMTNLSEGLTTNTHMGFVNLSDRDHARYVLRDHDVLLNRTNSHDLVGRTGVHKLKGPYVFASYLIRIRTDDRRLLPDYLCAFLNHPLGKRQVLRFATRGVSQSNINIDSLRRILLPLPKLRHQETIVNTLDTLRATRTAMKQRTQKVKRLVSLFLSSNLAPGPASRQDGSASTVGRS